MPSVNNVHLTFTWPQVCEHGHHRVGGVWASRQWDGPHRNRYSHSTLLIWKKLQQYSFQILTPLWMLWGQQLGWNSRCLTAWPRWPSYDGLTKMTQLWWPDYWWPRYCGLVNMNWPWLRIWYLWLRVRCEKFWSKTPKPTCFFLSYLSCLSP